MTVPAAVPATVPDFDQILFEKAAALQREGRLETAVALYRDLIAGGAKSPALDANLGSALIGLGRWPEAEACYRGLLGHCPENAEARNNLGKVLLDQGRYDEALEHLRVAVRCDPRNAVALGNLANALAALGDYADAIAHYRRARAAAPDSAVPVANLGALFARIGRPEAALEPLAQALALDPNSIVAHEAAASAYAALGEPGKAREALGRAVALDPSRADLAALLLFAEMNSIDWRHYRSKIDTLCRAVAQADDASLKDLVTPHMALALPLPASAHLKIARASARRIADEAPPPIAPRPPSTARQRLRVGYLSSDFGDHPVGQMVAGLMAAHDHTAFEVYAFATSADDGSVYRQRTMIGADHAVSLLGATDAEAYRMIRDQDIDVLIDLNGPTRSARRGVLARRPGRIQVNYLGYPGTSGAACMDYILVDETLYRDGEQAHYSEAPCVLPYSYQINDDRQVIAPLATTRTDHGLPADGTVLCCFNSLYKIDPDTFEIWMRILAQVEGAVLWLLCDDPEARENLRGEAAKRDVDGDRLLFAGRVSKDSHLARHAHADLFLDTRYYNAHTTASDALWAGVPLLTCLGETFASRVGASLLKTVGLPDLIAPDWAAYERLAVSLAADRPRLREIKEQLLGPGRASPLFDTVGQTRLLEAAYRRMWARCLKGVPPSEMHIQANNYI